MALERLLAVLVAGDAEGDALTLREEDVEGRMVDLARAERAQHKFLFLDLDADLGDALVVLLDVVERRLQVATHTVAEGSASSAGSVLAEIWLGRRPHNRSESRAVRW